mmetsp:Transcript_53652/g.85331  ORF Transcript_53652/g.85331 Transcript_53652/m.85331 type:complete len:126 (+) Transcript_53652:91-468(+)
MDDWLGRDLDNFWRSCPAPEDGLHRCCLLVKLFDYAGLTRKEHKIWYQVKELDSMLFKAGVFRGEKIQKNERVGFEAFACRGLREELKRHNEVKDLFRLSSTSHSPLQWWVLNVIKQAPKPEPDK